MAIPMAGSSLTQSAAAPKPQTILSGLTGQIHDRISALDDRLQNIGMSFGRLCDPRPMPPKAPGNINKSPDRPSTIEGELRAILIRLEEMQEATEELAQALQTAV